MKAKLQLVRTTMEPMDLDRLARATSGELQRIYRHFFDCAVPAANSEHARRKITWHLQAKKEGGLPSSARLLAPI